MTGVCFGMSVDVSSSRVPNWDLEGFWSRDCYLRNIR